jgi:hypothetical protein
MWLGILYIRLWFSKQREGKAHGFRRRDADGGDRDGRAPGKVRIQNVREDRELANLGASESARGLAHSRTLRAFPGRPKFAP